MEELSTTEKSHLILLFHQQVREEGCEECGIFPNL